MQRCWRRIAAGGTRVLRAGVPLQARCRAAGRRRSPLPAAEAPRDRQQPLPRPALDVRGIDHGQAPQREAQAEARCAAARTPPRWPPARQRRRATMARIASEERTSVGRKWRAAKVLLPDPLGADQHDHGVGGRAMVTRASPQRVRGASSSAPSLRTLLTAGETGYSSSSPAGKGRSSGRSSSGPGPLVQPRVPVAGIQDDRHPVMDGGHQARWVGRSRSPGCRAARPSSGLRQIAQMPGKGEQLTVTTPDGERLRADDAAGRRVAVAAPFVERFGRHDATAAREGGPEGREPSRPSPTRR